MAKIDYKDLFDFPGYEKAIKDAGDANKEFGTTVGTVITRIGSQYSSLKDELAALVAVLKQFNVNQKGAGDALVSMGAKTAAASQKAAEQKRIMQELSATVDLQTVSINKLKTGTDGLIKEYDSLGGVEEKDIARKKQIIQELGKQKAALEAQTVAQKNATNQIKLAEGSYNSLQAQLTQIGNKLKALPGAFDATTGKLNKNNKEAVALSNSYTKLNNTLKTADASLGNYQRNVGNYASAFKGLGSSIGNLIGIASAFQALRFTVNTNKDLESLGQALALVSGNAEQLAINQAFLTKVTDDFGLEIIDTTKSFKNFYASSTLAGISADETRKIFGSVAKSAANLKLSQDDVNGVLLAFGQIASKGKVQAEELRGQIGERLPGAFAVAAKAIGVTQQELNKMLQNGEVISSTFLPKFAAELEKTFGKTDRIEGMQASINRLQNAITRLATDGTGGFNKLFSSIINGATDAIEVLDKLLGNLFKLSSDAFNGVGFGASIVEAAATASDSYKKAIEQTSKDIQNTFNSNIAAGAAKAKEKGFSEIDLAQEQLKNLKAGNAELKKRIDLERTTVQNTKAEKDAYAQLFVSYTATQKAIGALDGKYATPTKPADSLAPSGKKGKTAAELLAESVKKQQEILQDGAEQQIKLFELAQENELISETEFQVQKLAIITDFTDKAIALEKTKGVNADTKEIANFNTKRIDAEIEYTKFANKSEAERLEDRKKAIQDEAEERVSALKDDQEFVLSEKKLTDKERKALELQYQNDIDAILITALDNRIKLETDAAKKANLEKEKANLQRGVNTRNRQFDEGTVEEKYETEIRAAKGAFDIIKAGRDTSFKEELAYLEKLKGIKLKYAKDTAEEELQIAELKAERERQLREELENTIQQGIQAGLEIAQNLVDGKFEERIANLEAEKQRELDLAGNNAAAKAAIEEKYNKKVAAEKNKQAKADRAFALFNVAINTAAGISKSIAEWGMPFAIPFIALTAIQGALQAGVILSKPLPKYKTGRKGGAAEYAVVDEEGPELIIDRHGRIQEVGGDQGPRLTYLEQGSKVMTAKETKQLLADAEVQKIVKEMNLTTQLSSSIRKGKQEEMIGVMAQAMKGSNVNHGMLVSAFKEAVKDIPIHQTIIDEEGSRRREINKNGRTTYLNHLTRF